MVYNINLKRASGGFSLGIFFTIFGFLFLLVFGGIVFKSFIMTNTLDGKTDAHTINWEINDDGDDDISYSPTYFYTVDEVEYSCSSKFSSSDRNVGGIVYYDTKNPSKCMNDTDKFKKPFLLLLILPVVFLSVGLWQWISYIIRRSKAKKLAMDGVLVKGIPYKVEYSNVSVNDVRLRTFNISFAFPDGIIRNLKSNPIYEEITTDSDGLCDMIYDPDNYNNYYIDLEITTTGFGNPHIIYYRQNNDKLNKYADVYNYNKFNK